MFASQPNMRWQSARSQDEKGMLACNHCGQRVVDEKHSILTRSAVQEDSKWVVNMAGAERCRPVEFLPALAFWPAQ